MELLSPVWQYILYQRLKKGKETTKSIAEKNSLMFPKRPNHPMIWGHAVGVGEALALAGLFAKLAKQLPAHHFLITSSTHTSAQALHKGQMPPRCIHQFAPLDTPKRIQLFLTYWQPILAIWCELDLWPGLIYLTKQANIPMYVVNANLSEQSIKRKRWAKYMYQALLNPFNAIYCQNKTTQIHFEQLGIAHPLLKVNGSIKALAPPLQVNITEFNHLNTLLNQRPCWLIASSHEGEEALALSAHQLICKSIPNALLLIAPRDPKRGHILATTHHLHTVQRSQGCFFYDHDSVYLCDTIGEMGLWYSLSRIALIGGSMVKIGGHNPYEALLLNCAVLHGQYTFNFKEVYEDLHTYGMTHKVNTIEEIAKAVINQLNMPIDQTIKHTFNQNIYQNHLILNNRLDKIFEPMFNELISLANKHIK